MPTITVLCNRCKKETTQPVYEKSNRLYIRCEHCGRAMRLKRYDSNGGENKILIPSPTGRVGNDKELVHAWIRKDIMRKLRKFDNYSMMINEILASYFDL